MKKGIFLHNVLYPFLSLGALLLVLGLASQADADMRVGGGAANGGRSGCFNPNAFLLDRRNELAPRGGDKRRVGSESFAVRVSEVEVIPAADAKANASKNYIKGTQDFVFEIKGDLQEKLLRSWKQDGCASVRWVGKRDKIIGATLDSLKLESGWTFEKIGADVVRAEYNGMHTNKVHCGFLGLKTVQETHQVRVVSEVGSTMDAVFPPASYVEASGFTDAASDEEAIAEERRRLCDER